MKVASIAMQKRCNPFYIFTGCVLVCKLVLLSIQIHEEFLDVFCINKPLLKILKTKSSIFADWNLFSPHQFDNYVSWSRLKIITWKISEQYPHHFLLGEYYSFFIVYLCQPLSVLVGTNLLKWQGYVFLSAYMMKSAIIIMIINLKLTIQTNGIYTTQNPSRKWDVQTPLIFWNTNIIIMMMTIKLMIVVYMNQLIHFNICLLITWYPSAIWNYRQVFLLTITCSAPSVFFIIWSLVR